MRGLTVRFVVLVLGVLFIALIQFSDRTSAKSALFAVIAQPDTFDVHGNAGTDNVLANDSDTLGYQLTVDINSPVYVAHVGQASILTNGQVNFSGSDGSGTIVVPYRVHSSSGAFADSTLTLNAHNAAPVGVMDVYETTTGSYSSKPGEGVLANDTDPDGDGLHTFYQSTAPLYDAAGHWEGQYQILADGTVIMSGVATFHGVLFGG